MKEVRSGENTQFSKNTGLYKGGTGRYALLAGGTEGEKFMTKGVVELLGSQSIDPRDKMNAIEQMVQYKAAYHRMRAEEEKKASRAIESLKTFKQILQPVFDRYLRGIFMMMPHY